MNRYDDFEGRRWKAIAATIFLFVTGIILIILYVLMAGVLGEGSDSGYSQWDELGDMFAGFGEILGVVGVVLIFLGFVSVAYAASLGRRPRKKMPRRVLRPKYR